MNILDSVFIRGLKSNDQLLPTEWHEFETHSFGLIMEHVHDKPWALGRELRPRGGPVSAPTMAEGKDLVVKPTQSSRSWPG